jgi:hypothetical protein
VLSPGQSLKRYLSDPYTVTWTVVTVPYLSTPSPSPGWCSKLSVWAKSRALLPERSEGHERNEKEEC